MPRLALVVSVLMGAFLALGVCGCRNGSPSPKTEQQGVPQTSQQIAVPDEAAAIRVAEAAIADRFGSKKLDELRPWVVERPNNDYWLVVSNPPIKGMPSPRAQVAVSISRASGQVIKIGITK